MMAPLLLEKIIVINNFFKVSEQTQKEVSAELCVLSEHRRMSGHAPPLHKSFPVSPNACQQAGEGREASTITSAKCSRLN